MKLLPHDNPDRRMKYLSGDIPRYSRRRARIKARRLAVMLGEYQDDPEWNFPVRSDAICLARRIGTVTAFQLERQFQTNDRSAS